MKDPGSLSAAADRAEALVRDLDAQVTALEAEEAGVKARLDAALSGGAGGKPVSALADQRDSVQMRLVSRRQDRLAAAEAAKAARVSADAARLAAEVAAVNAETAASDAVLEGLLVKVAAADATRRLVWARAVTLERQVIAFQRAHKVQLEGPAASCLPGDLLEVCEAVSPGLGVLADEREAAAHPRPPLTTSVAPPFLIATEGPHGEAVNRALRAGMVPSGHRRA